MTSEIEQYYKQNKDQFTRIEKVHARHRPIPDSVSSLESLL